MNKAEWLMRKKRIDTKSCSLNPAWQIMRNANVDRPACSLSASTGERVGVRSRSEIRPSCLIREFRNRPNPKVVVTVDMLSTGVDIPALEFIVFLRPVKSRILWEQMLGRGTRLCPDINKSKFVVFDCFDGTLIQYFRNVSSFDIEPPGETPLTLSEQGVEHDSTQVLQNLCSMVCAQPL